MDSVNRAAVTPNKSRLARTFAKVMHIRAATGVSPAGDGVQKTRKQDQGVQKPKTHDQIKQQEIVNTDLHTSLDVENDIVQKKAAIEAFLAKLFASISSIKAAYAQMQFSQYPYDDEGIQSADMMVVSELKLLSELKQCYLKKHFEDSSPETTQILAEIQEQKSLSKTFEIIGKKLVSEIKLKNSEITFLREKLEEANKENKILEKRLNSSGQLSSLGNIENLHFSILGPSHFITVLRQTVKTIRSFVRLMIGEMESAGWDLDAAANSIEPGVVYPSATHKCFAFESFVCREMFDGFNHPYFLLSHESVSDKKRRQRQFFDRFIEMKSQKPKEYLDLKPKSRFGKFFRTKYLRLVHPKMEASLFGNLNQRNLVGSGDFPETTFLGMFSEMAKRVWLLHCLAFAFQPEASIFQVRKRRRFSEVFMECVNEEAFLENDPRVAFTVVPGFKMSNTVIQSQVYLC